MNSDSRLAAAGVALGLLMHFALDLTATRVDTRPEKNLDGLTVRPLGGPVVGGGEVAEEDWKGRIAVINVWATWCAPCRTEIPILNEVARETGPEVLFLGVSVDDDQSTVEEFSRLTPLAYPTIMGKPSVLSKLPEVVNLPMTVVVEGTGRVSFLHEGAIEGPELRTAIATAMARLPRR